MEKAKMDHETELAEVEASKVKYKYESMANAKAMERAMRAESDARNKSFWGKLGDRVLSGIDAIGEAFSED